MDASNGHVNGARYIITKLSPHLITAELATGPHAGEPYNFFRIPFQPEDRNIPVEFQRIQFPIRQCFAMTSNKSQGQTAEKVGLYLKQDLFAHGQLYVSLSRVGHPDRIRIYKPVEERAKDKQKSPSSAHLFMKNVVYREILS